MLESLPLELIDNERFFSGGKKLEWKSGHSRTCRTSRFFCQFFSRFAIRQKSTSTFWGVPEKSAPKFLAFLPRPCLLFCLQKFNRGSHTHVEKK